jgi:hypothetical protein
VVLYRHPRHRAGLLNPGLADNVLQAEKFEKRKRFFLQFPTAKPRYKAATILKIYDLRHRAATILKTCEPRYKAATILKNYAIFIHEDIHYVTNSFCQIVFLTSTP